jgi:lambda family phage portal protein
VSEFVDAQDILHLYEVDRPGQVRGVPWAVAVLIKLKDLDEYDDATLLKQKIAACYTAFEQDSQFQEDLGTETADARDPVDTLEPGTVQRLGPGKQIVFASPPSNRDYPDFSRAQLHAIASGFGITYEALTGDYSTSNFSSSRMGWIEMQRNVRDWQSQLMISQFCTPIFDWFQEAALYAGLGTEGVRCDWTPPRREMIDPEKEINAQKLAIRSGFTTLPEVLREQGWEPEEALDEMQEAWEMVDERDLVLDCDPRRTSLQGQLESPPATASTNGPGVAPEVLPVPPGPAADEEAAGDEAPTAVEAE